VNHTKSLWLGLSFDENFAWNSSKILLKISYLVKSSLNIFCTWRPLNTSVADPKHFGVDQDPNPAIFIIDLQDANKN
jgi:hypothetical protein